MKKGFVLFALVALTILCAQIEPARSAVDVTRKGVAADLAAATGVADGTYDVYVRLKDFKRADFTIVQSGGSGTISYQVFGTRLPGASTVAQAATLTYIDVGLSYYGSATFTGATTELIDDGAKLEGITWIKLTFTVAGASADASYSVNPYYLYPSV